MRALYRGGAYRRDLGGRIGRGSEACEVVLHDLSSSSGHVRFSYQDGVPPGPGCSFWLADPVSFEPLDDEAAELLAAARAAAKLGDEPVSGP